MTFELQMLREPRSVPAGYQPQLRGDPPSLFRLNNAGMQFLLELMELAGCVYPSQPPELGCPPPPGLAAPRFEPAEIVTEGGLELHAVGPAEERALDESLLDVMADMREDYLEENDHILTRETLRDGRVASYKWETNDAHLVTPGECRAVASAVRTSLDDLLARAFPTEFETVESGRRWLQQWITFHELAAEHGGYRVY